MRKTAKDIISRAERNTKIHTLILDCLSDLEKELRQEYLNNADLFHITDTFVSCLRYTPEDGWILLTLGGLDYRISMSSLYRKIGDHIGCLDKNTVLDAVVTLIYESM